MNSVDPDYMNAAPEMQARFKESSGKGDYPVGWEDGAAELL